MLLHLEILARVSLPLIVHHYKTKVDNNRATDVSARLDAQQRKLNLPILPTITIGSFPQTIKLRRVRRKYKGNKISEEDYFKVINEEISKVVQLQEELDIDVLMYGEPERNMVEYFGIGPGIIRCEMNKL